MVLIFDAFVFISLNFLFVAKYFDFSNSICFGLSLFNQVTKNLGENNLISAENILSQLILLFLAKYSNRVMPTVLSICLTQIDLLSRGELCSLFGDTRDFQWDYKFRIKLHEALNKDLKTHWIRRNINSKLRYSFKWGSTRNQRAKSNTSIYVKSLFCYNWWTEF